MKKLFLGLLMLAGCVSSPQDPLYSPYDVEAHIPPARTTQLDDPMVLLAGKEFMATAQRHNAKTLRLQAAVNTTPLPEQTLSDRQLSVVVSGHLGAAQTRDKSWIVQTGPDTRIISYASSQGNVGAILNLPGERNGTLVGLSLNPMPKSVLPGDALIVVSSINGSDPKTDEAMAVVFVPYAVSSDMLRPPAIGNTYLPWFFRTAAPIYESQVDMTKCPSVINPNQIYQPGGPINPSAWGGVPRTVAQVLDGASGPGVVPCNGIRRFSGDVCDGWPVHVYSPNSQHAGYGTNFSGEVSTALCVMASTAPEAQRREIALAIVQRGLDQIGATCSNRVLYPLGGHCQGRKALVIATGHLLNVEVFCHPSVFFPNTFQEDGYRIVNPSGWWFGHGWNATWAFSLTPGFNGDQLINHPSTWGDPNSPTHSTFGWCFVYINQTVPSQIGTALFMNLIGREAEMGPICKMVKQWMGPIPQEALVLNAMYVPPWNPTITSMAWGQDFETPKDYTTQAYKLYYNPANSDF